MSHNVLLTSFYFMWKHIDEIRKSPEISLSSNTNISRIGYIRVYYLGTFQYRYDA
jgi:hypothetical protein